MIFLAKNVFESLLNIPEYKSASTIACYLHMGQHEIETDLIINNSFQEGKKINLWVFVHTSALFLTITVEIQENEYFFLESLTCLKNSMGYCSKLIVKL